MGYFVGQRWHELGVVAAVGVLIVNAKLDKVIGRVDEQGKTLTAHVNAPGLHR